MEDQNPGTEIKRERYRAALGIAPVALLIVGLVASLFGFRLIDDIVEHDRLSSFNLVASRQVTAIQQKLERNIETVNALGGLFDASEIVSRREFSIFARQMISRVGGVQALTWTPQVGPEGLSDIRRLARREGLTGYDFFQRAPGGGRQPLSVRRDYVPVLYAEPFETTRGALGFDLGSDPTRRAALDRARDAGKPVATAPLILLQERKNQFGFLVFRPIYLGGEIPETVEKRRQSIKGYSIGVYRITDIVAAALDQISPADTIIALYDGVGASRSSTPMYRTGGSSSVGKTEAAGLRTELPVHVAQIELPSRRWTVEVTSAAPFASTVQMAASWMFLAAGLTVTFLFYGLLVSGRRRNLVVARQVDHRTQELAQEIDERRTVEAALQRSERTYAKLAEMAPVGILIFKDRKVDQANLAAVSLLGAASPEDLIGRSRYEFLNPEDHDEVTLRWRSVVEGRSLESWKVDTLRLDGTAFPSVIRTEQVTIDGHIYAIVVIEDVSLEHRAEMAIRESEEKYRSLIEFFPQGVLLSEEGIVTQVNPAGVAIHGAQDEEELLGRDWMTLVKESHRERMLERRREMAAGNSVEPIELEMLRADGSSFWGRSQAMPVRVSGKTFFMTVFADITGRKMAEQEIRRANAELVRSNEELAQFAYVASHDLKEPLRMVSSYCDLIADRYTDKLDETGKKFIYFATDGARRMQILIDDLLLYSRVGRGGETEEPVDLNAVVADAIELMAESVRESGADITVGELPAVSGFRSELARLFQNLIGNAIKFRSDAPLKIEIRAERTDDWLTIAVADNGIGIAPDFREKVFGVFQRLHSRDKYEGTGIGLAICEKIVEQMGGAIRVEEGVEGGSTFVFTIPAERVSTHG